MVEMIRLMRDMLETIPAFKNSNIDSVEDKLLI